MKTLLQLFLIFAKIGGFTFGGGYAMLPMLQKEVVEKKGWATQEELMDYFAIGQCTPGIIAVNTATFIGYKTKGVIGGIFATLGLVTPSIVIITVIAAFISNFQDLQAVQWAFGGIRAAVVALILSSVIKLSKKSLIDIATVIIFIAVTLLSIFTDLSPAIYVVIAGICGIVIKMSKKDSGKGSADDTDKAEGGKQS
ncbi:MAG: chromate transporter [Faecalibacterium sp.]|nr:chromate transporter [Ruminococcus sp.]MCM1391484.1 chromate transporter [Ruminococcus sp.]MCM1485258.1 chromate transporter [Faecalibacterium sp.]